MLERRPTYGYFGPIGIKQTTPPREGYRYSLDSRQLSPLGEALGTRVLDLFHQKYNLPKPYELDLDAGLIYVREDNLRRRSANLSFDDQGHAPLEIKYQVHDLNYLKREQISPQMAALIKDSYSTEILLPDFAEAGQALFGNVPGLHEGYVKWSDDEVDHGTLQGEILMRAGGWTKSQLLHQRQKVLQRKWVPPFETDRQMLIYPANQEPMTRDVYMTAAAVLDRDNAPRSAEILRLIGADEASHYAWYRDLVLICAELDPEGTERDIAQVLAHFYMPFDPYSEDKIERLRTYRNSIRLNAETMAKRLYQYSKKMPISELRAMLIAAQYAQKAKLDEARLDFVINSSRNDLEQEISRDKKLAEAMEVSRPLIEAPRPNKYTFA